jgi:hypothetical protein
MIHLVVSDISVQNLAIIRLFFIAIADYQPVIPSRIIDIYAPLFKRTD